MSRKQTASVADLAQVRKCLAIVKQNDVRTTKVAVVTAGINAGIYENDHRLDVAIEHLLSREFSDSLS